MSFLTAQEQSALEPSSVVSFVIQVLIVLEESSYHGGKHGGSKWLAQEAASIGAVLQERVVRGHPTQEDERQTRIRGGPVLPQVMRPVRVLLIARPERCSIDYAKGEGVTPTLRNERVGFFDSRHRHCPMSVDQADLFDEVLDHGLLREEEHSCGLRHRTL